MSSLAPVPPPTLQSGAISQFDPASMGSAVQAPITTASDQLKTILDANGPLMQQAATQGNQAAAKRGLLNSSMGVQASQQAVIGAASPLAQQDANALNQGNQFNTSAANQANQANAGWQQDANKTNATNETAMNQWNAGQFNEAALKTMDVNNRTQLAGIEADYKNLLGVNQGASDMYTQSLKNISDIQNNKDMDAAAKQTAINSQMSWLRNGMSMIQNLNGVTGLVTF